MRIFKYVSAALFALVITGCDGDARPFEEAVEVRTENLKSIEIVPPNITVEKLIMNIGESVQFGLQGTTIIDQQIPLDGTDRQWQVTDESVASINDDGQLVARGNGDVGVFINLGGLESATYDLTVSKAELLYVKEIIGEPIIERCLPQDYQVTGYFDDESIRDLAGVNWSLATGDETSARLLNNPDTTVTVNGINTDTVSLTASVSGLSKDLPIEISGSLNALSISPISASIDVDATTEFAAFGAYDGAAPGSDDTDTASRTMVNVTESVDWQITGDSATVSNSAGTQGVVTGVSSGTANLTVSCGDKPSPVAVVTVSSSSSSDELSFSDGTTVDLTVSQSIVLEVSTGSVYSADNSLDNDDLTWVFIPDDAANPAITLVDDGVNAGRITGLNANEMGTIRVTNPDSATGSIRVEVSVN